MKEERRCPTLTQKMLKTKYLNEKNLKKIVVGGNK